MTEAALKASIQPAQWPDGACWRAYLRFLGLFLLYFALVYFGLGSLSVWLGRSMDLYAAWETRIPCVPFMVWIYLSLYAIFTLPLEAARLKAREILGQFPQAGYVTVVENWRQLPDGQIEFTVRHLPTAD